MPSHSLLRIAGAELVAGLVFVAMEMVLVATVGAGSHWDRRA